MQTALPAELFLSQQVRDIDDSAINRHGIAGFLLMTRAAQFSFKVLLERFPSTKEISVLCGSGNNAGDGYLLASIAHEKGIQTSVYYLSPPDKLSGDADKAYRQCKGSNVQIKEFSETCISQDKQDHLIVDALLGTGLNAPVRGNYALAIEYANQSSSPILAIDIPSGLNANTGEVMGSAIEADCTATFIALKLGLFTGEGRNNTGELFYDSLKVASSIISEQAPIATQLSISDQINHLFKRPRHFHKGNCGHTLIIGGDQGYGGAIMMAAEAAIRCGSGLTSVITHKDHCSPILTRTPEVMATSAENHDQIERLIEAATVIAIGPGLGQSAWSEKMLQKVFFLDKPVVLDADALNILSSKSEWLSSLSKECREKRIYTPHPGEASRLLALDNARTIQKDRLKAITNLAEHLNGHILLKGSGSLLVSPTREINLCPYGNPGMASGGMGDVLSGMIGSFVAQGLSLKVALSLATTLHAYAADCAAKEHGERGLCATDLIPYTRRILNKLIEVS